MHAVLCLEKNDGVPRGLHALEQRALVQGGAGCLREHCCGQLARVPNEHAAPRAEAQRDERGGLNRLTSLIDHERVEAGLHARKALEPGRGQRREHYLRIVEQQRTRLLPPVLPRPPAAPTPAPAPARGPRAKKRLRNLILVPPPLHLCGMRRRARRRTRSGGASRPFPNRGVKWLRAVGGV